MKLQQDIDDLDRMIDCNTEKDKMRSQVRLIARGVAALETDYARLAEDRAKSDVAAAKKITDLQAKNQALVEENFTLCNTTASLPPPNWGGRPRIETSRSGA